MHGCQGPLAQGSPTRGPPPVRGGPGCNRPPSHFIHMSCPSPWKTAGGGGRSYERQILRSHISSLRNKGPVMEMPSPHPERPPPLHRETGKGSTSSCQDPEGGNMERSRAGCQQVRAPGPRLSARPWTFGAAPLPRRGHGGSGFPARGPQAGTNGQAARLSGRRASCLHHGQAGDGQSHHWLFSRQGTPNSAATEAAS